MDIYWTPHPSFTSDAINPLHPLIHPFSILLEFSDFYFTDWKLLKPLNSFWSKKFDNGISSSWSHFRFFLFYANDSQKSEKVIHQFIIIKLLAEMISKKAFLLTKYEFDCIVKTSSHPSPRQRSGSKNRLMQNYENFIHEPHQKKLSGEKAEKLPSVVAGGGKVLSSSTLLNR